MAFFTAPKGAPQPSEPQGRPGITAGSKPFVPVSLNRYRMIGPNSFVLRNKPTPNQSLPGVLTQAEFPDPFATLNESAEAAKSAPKPPPQKFNTWKA
jgi:hypothetical protein